jgi:hypothetical protein
VFKTLNQTVLDIPTEYILENAIEKVVIQKGIRRRD